MNIKVTYNDMSNEHVEAEVLEHLIRCVEQEKI
jgi:hypothetical protein